MYNLQYHMAHHINARNFLCNECPRAYNTAADLAQHQRIHEKQRDPYKCEHCGMFFQIRSKYNTHMRIHQTTSSKGAKECLICNKMFVCLSSHNRIVHLGMRTYECSDCGKSFGKKSGLDRHTLTVHQKIKAFKCDVDGCCGAFGEKSQLTKHMRIHNEKDQSYCSFCRQHFDDIKQHFETLHQDLTHSCTICFKRFSKQVSLKIHVKVFHTMEKNFFCDYCPNKGFAERSQLKRHLRRHQDAFEFEADSFESDQSLMELEPEQVFVNDAADVKLPAEILLEAAPMIDVLVEIKEEIVSDDDNIVKAEPTDVIKSEPVDFEFEDVRLVPFHEVKEEATNDDESQKFKKMLKCKTCDERFDDKKSFQQHFDVFHPPELLDCVICRMNFTSKLLLDRHTRNEHEEVKEEDDDEVVCCPGCGIEFTNKNEMQKHFDDHHKTDAGVSCDKCGKKFNKLDHLKAHYLAAHTENKFECRQCGRCFSYKSALDRHIKVVHENQRDHECNKCGKSFGTRYDLSMHFEANHDESRKAQIRRTCTVCGKIFSKERNLQIHILAIHNDKSFECEICNKKFSFKSAKERHLKVVHYNQRSHQCSHCQKFFGTKYDLRNHIAYNHSLHPEEKGKYYCSTCEKSFTSSSALKRHIKGVHENIKQKGPRDYRCKFCKEVFSNKYQKEKHLAQVHQDGLKPLRACRLCNLEFQLCDDFKAHIESHPNAHICIICGQDNVDGEALNAHMEDHKHIEVQLRRFICDFCGHRLFNKIQLKVS